MIEQSGLTKLETRAAEVQAKMLDFMRAVRGEITLSAFRMYIETQERSDSTISYAMMAYDSPVTIVRANDGTPMVRLLAQGEGFA